MATTISTLKFLITADAGGLVEGVALTKKEIKDASAVSLALKTDLEKQGMAIAQLKRLHEGGALSAEDYAKALKAIRREALAAEIRHDATVLPDVVRTPSRIEGFAAMITPMRAVTASFAAATAGIAAFSAGVSLAGNVVMSRIESIDDLGDAAERLGVSASSLSTIRTAAFLGDVDPAAADGAIQKMLVNVGKGSKSISELGLNVERLKGMSTAKMFEGIAGAISKLPNKADQFAAMTEIFGKSGPEISNLVNKFAELKEAALSSGAVVGNELAADVAKADDAMKRASLTAEGWANTLTAVVSPAVTATVEALDALAKDRTQAGAAAGGVLGFLVGAAGDALGLGGVGGLAGQLVGQLAGQAGVDAAMDLRDKQIADARAARDAAAAAAAGIDLGEGENPFAEAAAKRQHDLIMRGLEEEERERQEMARREKDRLAELSAERDRRFADDAKRFQEGKRVLDSLRTPQEVAESTLAENLAALEAAGLSDEATRDKLFRRAAGEMIARDTPAGVGFAEKGTAAARQAVIESKQASRQVELLEQIAESLRKAAGADPIVIKEIGE